MKNKVLVVGIHGPYEPWNTILRNGQLETWMSVPSNARLVSAFGKPIMPILLDLDRKVYYLRWSPFKVVAYLALLIEAMTKSLLKMDRFQPRVRISIDNELGEVWEFQMPDSLMLQGVKNVAVFREALNHEFDFLVTTITSSYLNLPLLCTFLERIDPNNFVGGRIEKSGDMSYQQGSFRVYSRDVVENIVNQSGKYKHWKIEDIAMGSLVASLYSELVEIPNMTIKSIPEIKKLIKGDLDKTISYRCKLTENNIRKDVEVMGLLHNRILQG